MAAKKRAKKKSTKKSPAKRRAKKGAKKSARSFKKVASVGRTPAGKVRWLGKDGNVYERSKGKKRAKKSGRRKAARKRSR